MTYEAKRTRNRIDTRCDVEVKILAPLASLSTLRGTTRDISAAGVFVICGDRPPLGTKVQTRLTLPTTGMTLKNQGTVVRLEPDGFAVQFYEVLPNETNPLR